ncbi:IS1 transposase [Thioploca ingrica]|uniref:IS1 transposase n=1 Tax=Thioploca ingrica TaxID=40754 RepID=A0A090AC91_9GAMM|nr:IS1 transposase [Thioploca ingrica]
MTIEGDEIWSYVGNKASKSWIWLALDVASRQRVGYTVGQRAQREALRLWQSLPPVYRQCAVCYTDNWKAYRGILLKTRHRIVGKGTGKTNHIDRFNNTLRQRISRLGRKTLAFSKKLENHLGAIAYFIHYYNSSLL